MLSNVRLPEEVVDVLRQFVLEADDEDVLAYAQYGNKGLLKGLRATKQNAERIKQRLVKQLGVRKNISKDNTGFLRRHNPYSFFDGLEESTILTNLDALCASLGTAKVEAILMLCDRPELTALAERMISGEQDVKEVPAEDVEKFAARTFHAYLPFICEMRSVFDPEFADEADDGEAPEDESVNEVATPSGPCSECARLRDKLNQVKTDLKGFKKEAVRVSELEKKLARSEKQCTAFSETADSRGRELEKVRNELDRLHVAISSTVSEELNSSLHSWFQEPERLLAEVKNDPSADLMDRARQIIEKQEEVDRNAGNRKILSDRLRSVCDLRDQVNSLSCNSLNPLNDLPELLDELNVEADRLCSLLGERRESTFVQSFMARIGQAGSPDEIAEYRNLLARLNEAGVLDREELRQLLDYCEKRMDLAYDKRMPEARSTESKRTPLRSLKEAIVHNREAIWLLDGHNILHPLTDLFGELDSSGNPTEEARYRLSDALVALVGKSDQCQVRLYYDGPERSEYSPSENVTVIYSGGEGEHKADRAICAYLEYLRRAAPRVPAFITTDDRDLRSQCADAGGEPLSVDEFSFLLRHKRVGGNE